MGCCLGCEDPQKGELLAEYNPLLLGHSVDRTSIYGERLIVPPPQNIEIMTRESIIKDIPLIFTRM